MVTGSRDTTTVATQALYLLNDPFVRRRVARTWPSGCSRRTELDDEARVDLAYRLTLGRDGDRGGGRAGHGLSRRLSSPPPAELIASTAEAGRADGPPRRRGRRRTRGTAAKKPAPPVNPDEVPPVEAPVKEEVVQATDAKTAAWASFCQALLGTAEFRYVK